MTVLRAKVGGVWTDVVPGIIGPTGPTGTTGVTGATGATGPTGPQLPGALWYPHGTAPNNFSGGAHTQATPTPNPVVLGGGTILAGSNPGAFISTDSGLTWTQLGAYPATTTGWGGFSYGLGLFVACQRSADYANVATNPGTTSTAWTARAMPVSQFWQCTAFNGTTFVAVGTSSAFAATTQAASSINGTTWTSRTTATSAKWDAISWDGTKFIALSTDAFCDVSTDGITWTAGGTVLQPPLGTIATDGAGTCVVGYSAGYLYTRDHGTSWGVRQISGPASTGWHVSYANGYWFMVPYGATPASVMYVCATADLGKTPTPVVAAQSNATSPATSAAWVIYTGTNTIVGTRGGLLRA